jgi:hypothetical protein
MMPRIQAAEKLAGVELAALSANIGFERELDRQQLLDRLRDRAAGTSAQPPAKADPADLAGMGIAVRSDGEGLETIADLQEWLGNQGPDHG